VHFKFATRDKRWISHSFNFSSFTLFFFLATETQKFRLKSFKFYLSSDFVIFYISSSAAGKGCETITSVIGSILLFRLCPSSLFVARKKISMRAVTLSETCRLAPRDIRRRKTTDFTHLHYHVRNVREGGNIFLHPGTIQRVLFYGSYSTRWIKSHYVAQPRRAALPSCLFLPLYSLCRAIAGLSRRWFSRGSGFQANDYPFRFLLRKRRAYTMTPTRAVIAFIHPLIAATANATSIAAY